MQIVFYFLELKQDKKKSEHNVKRYEELAKEHVTLEKVSYYTVIIIMFVY